MISEVLESASYLSESNKEKVIETYSAIKNIIAENNEEYDNELMDKALVVALNAHKGAFRKSGEPYIFHPLAVAKIVAEELHLDALSCIGALLHDVVEDSNVTIADIEKMFGPKIGEMVDGLTKIKTISAKAFTPSQIQAENFKKLLLTLSKDIRVILIKIADRLHNLRTLSSMPAHKQLRICYETKHIYSPLAHRLGLYNIKYEMEDLVLAYLEPQVYKEISEKLEKAKPVLERYLRRFINPIQKRLNEEKIPHEIQYRAKAISSIYEKMKRKNVSFKQIYDILAVRIILDVPPNKEKQECWRVYSIITDYYPPNPERFRDWLSIPKSTGYEALHTTVMTPSGRWVEVQIRSKRMDEIAENGLAAHWKYKNIYQSKNEAIEKWLDNVKEFLENPSPKTWEFIEEFRKQLTVNEIYVFTPKGDMIALPDNATVLDFAFAIHSEIGLKAIGAKVNDKMVPLNHVLKTGDQVHIITSEKQKPSEDWLTMVVTPRARQKIRSFLNQEKKNFEKTGEEILKKKFEKYGIIYNPKNVSRLRKILKIDNDTELFYKIASTPKILSILSALKISAGYIVPEEKKSSKTSQEAEIIKEKAKKNQFLIIGDDITNIKYDLAKCCSPIPGDEVFGYVKNGGVVVIHRISCPRAEHLVVHHADRIIKARWNTQTQSFFPVEILIEGQDRIGIAYEITKIISTNMKINMKAISFEIVDTNRFQGKISLFIKDVLHLQELIDKIKEVKGVDLVKRTF